MKKIGIYTYTALLMIMAAALYSCEPDDNEKEWGNTKVYMPQAAILDGGLSNNYPVPLNNNASTNNYKVDSETNTLKIVLGVYRSGLQELQAFSVDVAADLSATATAVPAVTKGIALPTDVYSLPGKVSVDGGKRESIFYLDVDLNKLINDYPDYNTKQMVLVVAISNPSQYELNTNLAKTTVIIDGASFMPVRKIVQGGDFEAGSEAYWTFLNTNATVLPNTFASITNGALIFDFGNDPVNGGKCCYHTIELENEAQYKFSCDITTSDASSITDGGCRFFVAVSSVEPVEGVWYKYDTGSAFFTVLDAWNGLKNPIVGTLPQNGGWQGGIEKSTGVFTSNFSGTGYVVTGIAAWNSGIGKIVIDNVKIEEQ